MIENWVASSESLRTTALIKKHELILVTDLIVLKLLKEEDGTPKQVSHSINLHNSLKCGIPQNALSASFPCSLVSQDSNQNLGCKKASNELATTRTPQLARSRSGPSWRSRVSEY
ncbi:hypothetical protein TNCV_1966781 [Trichonephila clavipes]|nr:hypothetical protein TNCV_1966781 [Trichonephila clavipes]